jgi:cbb3-type cytochrome oxidase maturation protein
MSGLVLLIPIAVVMGLASLFAFLWALRSGQYDDLEGAGERVLDDTPLESRATSRPTREG